MAATTPARSLSVPVVIAIGAMTTLGLGAAHTSALLIGLVLALLAVFAITHSWLLAWRRQLALLILVILFIPIQLYSLGGGLPFQLEPYRILVALMLVAWLAALLVDPRVRFRKTGLEGPI